MNLIKERLKIDNQYIIIDFSTRLNVSLNSIIQDYFDTVEAAIKKYSLNLAKEIRKYGNSVLKISNNNFFVKIIDNFDFLSNNSLSSEFTNTNEQLKK